MLGVVTSVITTVAVPQLSEAVKTAAVGTASQDTATSIGVAWLKVGGVISITFIVCEAFVALPQVSVAVQVLVIV